MIIAITDERGGMEKSIVAGRLAAARALAGRKVLLLDADPRQGALTQARVLHGGSVDAGMDGRASQPRLMARAISAKGLQPELEHLVHCYHDIVIDSESRDSMGSRSALVAARVLVVALDEVTDRLAQERLARRIAHARSANPALRVLLATDTDKDAAHALAGQIPSARVVGFGQLYCAVFDTHHPTA